MGGVLAQDEISGVWKLSSEITLSRFGLRAVMRESEREKDRQTKEEREKDGIKGESKLSKV